jgi:hypothetical protein
MQIYEIPLLFGGFVVKVHITVVLNNKYIDLAHVLLLGKRFDLLGYMTTLENIQQYRNRH